jgi:endoglucanase
MMKCYSLRGLGLAFVAAFLAACSDSPVDFEQGGDMANGKTPPLDIWWPSNGANVSGVQPFKARLGSWSLGSYEMYWQVDGGQLNRMGDSYVDAPHKESAVNVSAFDWRGAGPYRITFVARDRSGAFIAQKSVDITVGTNTAPPPPSPTPPSGSIFASGRLWIDPNSRARQQADAWRSSRPADAAQMDKVAAQPQAVWFNGWHSDIRSAVASLTGTIVNAGALPLYVVYNVPYRDCGSYSAGGLSAENYRTWVRAFAAGLGATRAAIILEPDALANAGCLSTALRDERYALIADAVDVFKAQGSAVYIDAGHSAWISATEMANRLNRAGIARADGFSLNVSNFQTTSANATYGTTLSSLVGGKHFVIDTSRNGLGPTADNQWCNPADRGLGSGPTASTGNALIDAFLWIKKPGESDGSCNGGPAAGQWWADYALGLAQRTPVMVAYGG